MPATKKKSRYRLDEERFAQDVVSGRLGPAELAARHGVSLMYVSAVLAGRKRRCILRRIEQALACECRSSLWRLVSLQREAIQALENAVKSQPGGTSLAAAKEILNRSLEIGQSASAKAPKAPVDRPAAALPIRLPQEAKRRVLAELDGPPPEPMTGAARR